MKTLIYQHKWNRSDVAYYHMIHPTPLNNITYFSRFGDPCGSRPAYGISRRHGAPAQRGLQQFLAPRWTGRLRVLSRNDFFPSALSPTKTRTPQQNTINRGLINEFGLYNRVWVGTTLNMLSPIAVTHEVTMPPLAYRKMQRPLVAQNKTKQKLNFTLLVCLCNKPHNILK